jgi:hypothetical protein
MVGMYSVYRVALLSSSMPLILGTYFVTPAIAVVAGRSLLGRWRVPVLGVTGAVVTAVALLPLRAPGQRNDLEQESLAVAVLAVISLLHIAVAVVTARVADRILTNG